MYNDSNKRQTTRNQRRRKIFGQRLMGVVLLAIAVFLVWLTVTANEDSTGGVLAGVLSLPLLFSKNPWII